MARQLPEITPAVLAQWREAAERDIKTGQPFKLHPFAILAVIERLEAYDEARDSMDNLTLQTDGDPGDIIEVLREERIRKGIAQKDVAARMRVSAAVLSRFEGNHNSPNVSTLIKYAAAIGGRILITYEDSANS